MNNLTPEQIERLSLLAEECGEVIQMVGKVLRHGYDSRPPADSGYPDMSNTEFLELELADLSVIINMMHDNEDINMMNFKPLMQKKKIKLEKYIHHNHKLRDF